jgi:two-component system, chemotaxis family, sensor kinase CheA
METEQLIRRLMATFVDELDEHVHALNRDLLELEKRPDLQHKGELFKTLFRTAHSLKGAARSVNAGAIESTAHQFEELLANARKNPVTGEAQVLPQLFALADSIEEAGKRLKEQQVVSPPVGKPVPKNTDAPPSSTVVRVSAEKLDGLLARSTELTIARAGMAVRLREVEGIQESVRNLRVEASGRSGASRARIDESLRRIGRDLERLATSLANDGHALEQAAAPLDEGIRAVRMVPFSEICIGIDRVVRDLATSFNKDVRLIVEGSAIELDRSVAERLKDPLMHLVRNAVDHGIEPVPERVAAGKPAHAKVKIAAMSAAGRIEIIVSDDGRGLDVERIRNQARQHNLPTSQDPRELARLIFMPGFSTAKTITEVSGRGVGLDLVQSRLESLQGSVDCSFEPGQGMWFTLTAPLTLTTIRVLLVTAGSQTFAIAVSNIDALRRVGAEDIRSVEGREVLMVNDMTVPIAWLSDILGLGSNASERVSGKVPVVLVGAGGRRIALLVDELLTEQEALVKDMGIKMMRTKNIAGIAMLPNGRSALLLKAADLVLMGAGISPSRTLAMALAGPAPEKKKRRLLVADDSLTTRTLERTILEAAGYDVTVAVDGLDAWKLLQDKEVDLVLTDIEMPRMDGFALTEAIRSSSRCRDLPVVLMTALDSDADKARGADSGANAYVVKSAFDQQVLLQIIEQLL